jgi:hypothetical protein
MTERFVVEPLGVDDVSALRGNALHGLAFIRRDMADRSTDDLFCQFRSKSEQVIPVEK